MITEEELEQRITRMIDGETDKAPSLSLEIKNQLREGVKHENVSGFLKGENGKQVD